MLTLSSLLTALGQVPAWVRIVTLGGLSWSLCTGLPALYADTSLSVWDGVALLLGPLCLCAGAVLNQRAHRTAPFVLLSVFPIALSLGASRIPHDDALSMFSPATLLVAMLGLAAYGATALHASDLNRTLRQVEHKPLGEVAQVAPSTRRRQAARVLLSVLTLGLLFVLAYSSAATPARYREHWGLAADAGAVVAALAAGIVGCIALMILAPALRAERPEQRPESDRAKRLTWLFLVAASGLVVYALMR